MQQPFTITIICITCGATWHTTPAGTDTIINISSLADQYAESQAMPCTCINAPVGLRIKYAEQAPIWDHSVPFTAA